MATPKINLESKVRIEFRRQHLEEFIAFERFNVAAGIFWHTAALSLSERDGAKSQQD